MLIPILSILALALLAGLGSFASYLRLLMRRLTPVATRKVFGTANGDDAGFDRERIGISISALHGALMASFAAGVTELVFTTHPDHPWASLGSSLLIILGVIAIFDQLIPFILVARHDEPEKILLEWCPLLRHAVYLASPLIFPILISTTIRRLLETDGPEPEEPTPQEDLQELLEVGQQEGLIEKEEGEILQSVVEFGDTLVREIMTPRTEIAALEINATAEDLRSLFREKRHSRFPVYQETLDQIEGYVNVGDLMEAPPEVQSEVTLRSLLKPVPFVPETKRSMDLLKEMQRSTTQLAIVIDEYGSVAGLVRKACNRWVRFGQRRSPQIKTGRKSLHCSPHDARGVLGLNLALNHETQLGYRPVHGEGMRDIAEGVLVFVQPAILRNLDPPSHDVLSVVIARRQTQVLNDAARRLLVAVRSFVQHANAHGALN